MPSRGLSLLKLLHITTESTLITIGVVPLYTLGNHAVFELAQSNSPEIKFAAALNGTLCAIISFPFSFQFVHNETSSLYRQWKIANKRGKSFLIATYLAALGTTGIINCYYMSGNIALKIIAYILPGLTGRAIMANWLLNSNLTINKSIRKPCYQKTFIAFQYLTILLNNLHYNDEFKQLVFSTKSEKEQTLIRVIIDASKDFSKISTAMTQLKNYIETENKLVVANFQIKFPRFGFYFDALKIVVVTAAATYASTLMYDYLAPKAGGCIYGSEFNYSNNGTKIICPIKNTTLKNMGAALGYGTFGIQTLIVIFPILALFDIMWASSHNRFKRSRTTIYLLSFFLAACRSSIFTYMEYKNDTHDDDDANLVQLIYVGIMFLFYNFFSMAVSGPHTLKTIIRIVTEMWQSLKTGRSEDDVEKTPLTNSFSHNEATIAVDNLIELCLFQPEKVNDALTPHNATITNSLSTSA